MDNKKIARELIRIAKELTGSKFKNKSDKFRYQLLSRMQSDCEYYLNHGNRSPKHLWSGDVESQIADMKELFKSFKKDEKPEWISWNDILKYEKKMLKK